LRLIWAKCRALNERVAYWSSWSIVRGYKRTCDPHPKGESSGRFDMWLPGPEVDQPENALSLGRGLEAQGLRSGSAEQIRLRLELNHPHLVQNALSFPLSLHFYHLPRVAGGRIRLQGDNQHLAFTELDLAAIILAGHPYLARWRRLLRRRARESAR